MNQLVSIIIPCYNAEKYIAETIQSVINQTYTDWELIIVNDGSTDTSKEIIEKYKNKDQRISIINKTNSGVSDSRNKGLSLSKGAFISLLDADDILHKDNLEKKVNFLLSNDVGLVYSYCQIINENDEPTGKILKGDPSPTLKDFLSLKGNYNTAPSGIVLKRQVIEKIKGYDINLSNNADQDILIQSLARGFKIGLAAEILWNYRIHAENMSKNVDVLEKDTIYLFKKCEKQQLFYSFWFKKKCFARMYYLLAGSWWKNENNKLRGLYFICLAFITFPPSVLLLFRKSTHEY